MKHEETISKRTVESILPADLPPHPFQPAVVPLETVDRNGRHLNKFFKALSDQTRRAILKLLEKRDHTVGEIVDRFTLSQPTISRHLSVLKEARLVSDRRNGQFVVYSLSGSAMAHSAREFFDSFRDCRPQELVEHGED